MEAQLATAPAFSYAEFTDRNLGFVLPEEQARLQRSSVFVCGTGGMGGACIQSLVRTGIGELIIADFDVFELSNLNRQPFADLSTVGRPKAEVTAGAVRRINPDIRLTVLGRDWTERLDELLRHCKLVVNGMDDVRAGIHLYRKAQEHGATVIDAYTSPLPSITRVMPADPRPEERLGFPTLGQDWQSISDAQVRACMLREIEYVLAHSSSRRHIILRYAQEMVQGKRSRMSFAPMVLCTGNLMCFEAVGALLDRPSAAGYRGYFLNPWSGAIERPRRGLRKWLMEAAVRHQVRKLLHAD